MSLELIGGPMYSGKSSCLLTRLSCDVSIGKKVLYINHDIDVRSEEAHSTHNPLLKNNLQHLKNLTMIKCSELPTLNHVVNYDTIGIDEFSFFKNYSQVLNYVEQGDKRVICSGLSGDSQRHQFGHLLDLIPYCDSYTQLHAYCIPCSQQTKRTVNALFTHRYAGDTHQQIEVGAIEKYIPVCRQHYMSLNNL